MKIDISKIRIVRWPAITATPEGYERVWDVDFLQSLPGNIAISETQSKLSHSGFLITIEPTSKCSAKIRVITSENGWPHNYVFWAFDMFWKMEELLGPIERINNQSRSVWDQKMFKVD